MDSKERLKILGNMLNTMTDEEFDKFISEIYQLGFQDGDIGFAEAYELAFAEVVTRRS